ncbi:methionyl-tRNA formyltransferase [Pseudofulvimonas gallinarii]|jgi:methionyl-tRNA formyltransferase|uniref:Methionyl-tRNA formyltransferase n=1 Tax=Pseudofulvimonas gallinarii TaxID=634155 RepID=A0A4R3LL54_9GAMM|nr:methionyl-tRNA formyltransferase [Pseudofulvimonas gallinarii]TCT00249.1 methionyl-tRNA formyltransferase [Pseudofulvimonas gallinarii]
MSGRMRLVFAGTPDFAVPGLEAALASGHEVVAVYTQPDRPAGRGRQLAASPVKQRALAAGVPVLQPQTLRDAQAQAELAALAPDLMIVIAYGLILPKKVLVIPRHGCWNVHASLLPRWRGAAPIQRALLAGDRETGVCLMQMEAGLDTGPVILEAATPIHDDDTGQTLHDRLSALGAQVLGDGLQRLANGLLPAAQAQPADGVTYAHKLEKSESQLDWSQPAAVLDRTIRAFEPWPGTQADVAGEALRIWQARPLDQPHAAAPGTVLRAGRDGIDIACGEGALRLLGVQRAGGRRIGVADYLNGRPTLLSS